MLKKLIKILSYIPNEKGIYLGDDVFLTGRELDGSDKVYGFINDDGLKIETRASIYPINDM